MDELLIHKYITEKRFSKYASLSQYEENLSLSKQYYIPLSILEVSLRNAVNQHFEKFYGAGWLLNESSFLQKDHLSKIFDAKNKIKSRKESLNKDKLVAELSFGFWVNLFKSSYDRQMRIANLKQIFTNLPSKDIKLINRNELFQKINHIRNFRNRIFHHEKIVNNIQYQNIEIQIDEILGYLHEDILSFSKRLNHVH